MTTSPSPTPSDQRKALIFGAGKIGRGFVGHLLFLSGYRLTFVDASPAVVAELNQKGSYLIEVLGVPEKNVTVTGVRAIASGDAAAVERAVAEHSLFVCSVGGVNIPAVGALMGRGLAARLRGGDEDDVNVIVCENFKDPASILRSAVLAAGGVSNGFADWAQEHLGIAETQVLRSCIEPDAELKAHDRLAVRVQDWWVLPCDADAIRGEPPEFEGLSLRPNFQNELIRKVYTYNCSNATISYLGYLRGYEMLYEAANDPDILAVTRGVYEESGKGLIAEYDFNVEDQRDLQNLAIDKYRDRKILDPIERNGRDSLRKLSPSDRLLGPANIAIKHGVEPRNLALAVAAGLHYAGSDDPGTRVVQDIMRTRGLAAALSEVCKLKPDALMARLIREAVPKLKPYNHRGVTLVTE